MPMTKSTIDNSIKEKANFLVFLLEIFLNICDRNYYEIFSITYILLLQKNPVIIVIHSKLRLEFWRHEHRQAFFLACSKDIDEIYHRDFLQFL